jgi:hypothetical protein
MLSASFDIVVLLAHLEMCDWRSRLSTPMAGEVLEGYTSFHRAVERCVASREDYEVESYECCGDLFVFHRMECGALVVDYYKLDEEVYEQVYKNLKTELLPQRVLRKLRAALDA